MDARLPVCDFVYFFLQRHISHPCRSRRLHWSRAGKILGYYWTQDFPCEAMREMVRAGDGFPALYAGYLAGIAETRANLPQEGRTCVFGLVESCRWDDIRITVVPVLGAGVRLGAMLLAGSGRYFTPADLVLA